MANPDDDSGKGRPFRRLRLAARLLFVAGMTAIVVLSFASLDQVDVPGGDKLHHAAAYYVVAACGFTGFRRRRHLWLFAAILIVGAGIEFAQSGFTRTRVGDPADFLADLGGVVLGWATGELARALASRLARLSPPPPRSRG